jgi:hypothetical protein
MPTLPSASPRPPRRLRTFLRPLAVLAALLLSTAAVTAAPSPPASALPPILILPGAPATELVDRKTGELVWPNAHLMISRDGNDRLALPLDDPENTSVVPGNLLRQVRVLGLGFPVHAYDGLEARLRAMGYRAGDWRSPAGAGEYYYFLYDWRQGVESTARRFSREVAELYRRMPADTPPAVVIAHSLGGLVARYSLMYGDTPLGDGGPLPRVTWAGAPYIGTLFLVATPNEGTFMALKCLEKGSFYRWHHGAFSPATLFTFPAMFDMLPFNVEPLIDAAGRPLPFHLDDPDDWERLGWSMLDRRRQAASSPGSPPFAATHAALRAHVERELRRHARLGAALSQVGERANPAALHVVGSLSQTVQRTALVTGTEGRVTVRFKAPAGERQALEPLLFEPGDLMVADRSLTAAGSRHDPASTLYFRSVRHSPRSHQGLLSSPEILAALDEVLATVQAANAAHPPTPKPPQAPAPAVPSLGADLPH